jgi:hypothetical protein
LSEDDELELDNSGHLLALTSSNDVNIFACRKLKNLIGENNVHRLITVNEIKFDALSRPSNILFSNDTDYIKLIELVRKYPDVKEYALNSTVELQNILKENKDSYIPLLLRRKDKIFFITVGFEYQYQEGDTLAYIGDLN